MIQQSYKYVRLSLQPCEKFFELKITKNIEISLGRLEKSELLWEPNFFYSYRCVACRPHHKLLMSNLAPLIYVILYNIKQHISKLVIVGDDEARFVRQSNSNDTIIPIHEETSIREVKS